MRVGDWYRHPNNTTICMEVLKSFYIKEKDAYSMRIMWWKWSPKRGVVYTLGIAERVKWSRDKCKEWELL